MRRTPFFLAALVALSLVACGSDDTDAGADRPTTTGAERTTTTTAEEGVVTGEAEVTLLDAGAEPRRRLRLSPEVGTTQQLTMRQEQSQEIEVDGQTQAITAPATEFDIDYEIVAVDDEEIEAESHYRAGRVDSGPEDDPEIVRTLEEVVAAFEGASGSAVFDTRARVRSMTLPPLELGGEVGAVTDAMTGGMEEQAAALAVPFPAEEVGVGARWEALSNITMAGLAFRIVTEVDLVEVDAGRAVGEFRQELTLVPGPATIGGVSIDVVSGLLDGGGTITWDLTGVAPYMDQALEGEIVMEAQGQRLTQRQRQQILLTPRA